MKRNPDLVRSILLAAEDDKNKLESDAPLKVIIYHVRIMTKAGLIEGDWTLSFGIEPGRTTSYSIGELTWDGQELLSAMRDQTIWKKAQSTILKEGGSWTFELLKAWLTWRAKEKLGMP